MLMKKLGSYYYGKKQVKLYDSRTDRKEPRNAYMISLDWFKKVVGVPNIKEVETEGDIGSSGFNYEEGVGEV